jgi:hypothetical protein
MLLPLIHHVIMLQFSCPEEFSCSFDMLPLFVGSIFTSSLPDLCINPEILPLCSLDGQVSSTPDINDQLVKDSDISLVLRVIGITGP